MPMKEISCKLLVIGAGPGGYVCAIRAGQLGIDTVDRRGEEARRHLPHRRLHPVQGADPRRRRVREDRPHGGRQDAARHLAGRRRARPQAHRRLEGRHRRAPDQRRRRPAEEGEGQDRPWLGEVPRRQDGRGRDRDRHAGDPRRNGRDRHRLGAGRTAVPAVRRHGDLVDRGAVAAARCRRGSWWSAAAISGWSSAPPSPSWARKVTRRRGAAAHPAALRCRADAAGRQAACRARRRGADRRQGQGPRAEEAARCWSRPRTARRRSCRPTRSWSRSAASRCTEGWGLEELALDMAGRFIRIDDQCRTSMRGVYAIGDVTGEPMLAHRAMAQGEMVAEIVAGQQAQLGQALHSGHLLHRSGSGRRPACRRTRRGRSAARSRPGCSRSRPTAAP